MTPTGDSAAGRILFVTSNGTGLGHLTRAMAIARRLDPGVEASILTLSAAAPVAAEAGFHVEYFPSHTTPAAESSRRWDRRLRRRVDLLLDELRPGLLVFDGAHPYDGLVAVLRGAARRGLATAWLRRGMWRPGVGSEGIYWTQSFDAVVEPGELAAAMDRGLTASRRDEAIQVPPIVYLDEAELLPREQAERELGLEPGRVNALVALGQGADLSAAVERALKRLAREEGVQVAALESSLAPGLEVPEGVVHLRATYPMSRYYRAFDLAVSAAGYNAFHELLAHGVPSLFVPMPRQLDDQAARARWAADSGVGEWVEGPLDAALEERLGALLVAGHRSEIRDRIAGLGTENGAAQAAAAVEGLLGRRLADSPRIAGQKRQTPGSPSLGAQKSSRWARLAVSAQLVRRVGHRLPAIVARRASDRLRNPPPAPAKLIVPALGLEDDAVLAALHATSERHGVAPGRVLAITDSLNFAALRSAGFAFEYVPGEAQAEPVLRATGESYADFSRRRVEEAIAVRSRARIIEPGAG